MHDVPALITLMLAATVLLWALPSCGDPKCVAAHSAHNVAARAASIERDHMTFHSADRPQPTCSLCQSRKRDDAEWTFHRWIECYWCSSPGRVSYHGVPFCTWHLMFLYLGLNMLESRNRA